MKDRGKSRHKKHLHFRHKIKNIKHRYFREKQVFITKQQEYSIEINSKSFGYLKSETINIVIMFIILFKPEQFYLQNYTKLLLSASKYFLFFLGWAQIGVLIYYYFAVDFFFSLIFRFSGRKHNLFLMTKKQLY